MYAIRSYYAKVDNSDITQTVASNWLNGMSGKVAGLTFNSASTRITSYNVCYTKLLRHLAAFIGDESTPLYSVHNEKYSVLWDSSTDQNTRFFTE